MEPADYPPAVDGAQCPMPLIASAIIVDLAKATGIDLNVLRLAEHEREVTGVTVDAPPTPRMLDWPGASSEAVSSPLAAWRFLEQFELFPGIVVRGWGAVDGRLGFGLDGDRVIFELHVPAPDLLITGDPDGITVAFGRNLPETVLDVLIGRPLESLVAWPPASGPDHVISSMAVEDGLQSVSIPTTPMPVPAGANGRAD